MTREPVASRTVPAAVRNIRSRIYYLRTEIRFTQGSQATIFIRGQGADSAYGYKTPTDTGYRLDFDPNQRKVSLRRWFEWDQRGALQEIAYTFSKDQPTVVEVFLDGDILEVFLDSRWSDVCPKTQPAASDCWPRTGQSPSNGSR